MENRAKEPRERHKLCGLGCWLTWRRAGLRPAPTARAPKLKLASGLFFRLTHSYMGMYIAAVPRAATTSDSFNAVAEPRRREILNYLAMQERPVGEIVAALGLEQPSVSKHLRVLRDVGLVRVRREGRNMLYSLDAEAIRPMYEWTQTFERFWKHQLQRVKERAEERAAAAKGPREDPERTPRRRNNSL